MSPNDPNTIFASGTVDFVHDFIKIIIGIRRRRIKDMIVLINACTLSEIVFISLKKCAKRQQLPILNGNFVSFII